MAQSLTLVLKTLLEGSIPGQLAVKQAQRELVGLLGERDALQLRVCNQAEVRPSAEVQDSAMRPTPSDELVCVASDLLAILEQILQDLISEVNRTGAEFCVRLSNNGLNQMILADTILKEYGSEHGKSLRAKRFGQMIQIMRQQQGQRRG